MLNYAWINSSLLKHTLFMTQSNIMIQGCFPSNGKGAIHSIEWTKDSNMYCEILEYLQLPRG